MSQTINLSKNQNQSDTYAPEQFNYNNTDTTPQIALAEHTPTDTTLNLMFPGRVLFSIKETATILNVSYEFVRARTMSQTIPSIQMASRRMISIDTINYLINNGL